VVFKQVLYGAQIQTPDGKIQMPDLDAASVVPTTVNDPQAPTAAPMSANDSQTPSGYKLLLSNEAIRTFQEIFAPSPSSGDYFGSLKIPNELSFQSVESQRYYEEARAQIVSTVVAQVKAEHPELDPKTDALALAEAVRSTLIQTYQLKYLRTLSASNSIDQMARFAAGQSITNPYTGEHTPTLDCDVLANLVGSCLTHLGVPSWGVVMTTQEGLHESLLIYDQKNRAFAYYEASATTGSDESTKKWNEQTKTFDPTVSLPFAPKGTVIPIQDMELQGGSVLGIGRESVDVVSGLSDLLDINLSGSNPEQLFKLAHASFLLLPTESSKNKLLGQYYEYTAQEAQKSGDAARAQENNILALRYYQRADLEGFEQHARELDIAAQLGQNLSPSAQARYEEAQVAEYAKMIKYVNHPADAVIHSPRKSKSISGLENSVKRP
jgi:hypothetical protein